MQFLDWTKDRIFGLKLYFFPRFRSCAAVAGSLESTSNVNRGAIPKRPLQLPKQSSLDLQQPPLANNEDSASSEAVEPEPETDETVEQHSRQNSGRWHRKALRRRPPTPPSTSTTASEMSSSTAGPSDLRQRILEILTTNNNQDCDRELNRYVIYYLFFDKFWQVSTFGAIYKPCGYFFGFFWPPSP